MRTAIIILTLVANFIAMMLDYRMFAGVDRKEQIQYAGLGYLANFVITLIVYSISSIGLPANVVDPSRWLIIFITLPLNVIILFTPLVKLFMLFTNKDSEEEAKKVYGRRFKIYACVAIVILTIEVIYIQSVLSGIVQMGR